MNSSIPDEPVPERVIAIVPEDTQYEILFEPGYEPDAFWFSAEYFEFPVYGSFKAQAITELVSLDVNKLVYADGRAASKGAIPKSIARKPR